MPSQGTPWASRPTAANWAAPANTMTLIASPSTRDRPACRAASPYTSANAPADTAMPMPSVIRRRRMAGSVRRGRRSGSLADGLRPV